MGKLTKITGGVDWVTATVGIDETRGAVWAAQMSGLWNVLEGGKAIRKSHALNGYSGVMCGSLFIGEGRQGWIVQCSGINSDIVFKSVLQPFVNISRLDLQVTLYGSEHIPLDHARKHYTALREWVYPYVGKAPGGSFIENSKGGWTQYVGSNSSPQKGRIYDKWLESTKSEEYKYAIRYEVQLRDEQAKGAAQTLARGDEVGHAYEVENFVRRWYGVRGVSVPYEQAELTAVMEVASKNKSDIATKLRWLENQVRPTVEYLAQHVPMEEILSVLGIHTLASFDDSPAIVVDKMGSPAKWTKH